MGQRHPGMSHHVRQPFTSVIVGNTSLDHFVQPLSMPSPTTDICGTRQTAISYSTVCANMVLYALTVECAEPDCFN